MEGPSSSSWNCSACTFLNTNQYATQCEVCLTKRRMPKTSSSSSPMVPSSEQQQQPPKTATASAPKKKRQTTLFGALVVAPEETNKNTAKRAKKATITNHSTTTTTTASSKIPFDQPQQQRTNSNPKHNNHNSQHQPLKSEFESNPPNSGTQQHVAADNSSSRNSKALKINNSNNNDRVADGKSQQLSSVASSSTMTKRPPFLACSSKTLQNVPLSTLQERAQQLMTQVFGISQLRALQPQAVTGALQRQSQIVVMATGGGKSLCFQLPALVLGGTTIVVSPLKALIADQVQALQQKNIAAAFLSSQMTEGQKLDLLERLLQRSLRKSSSTNKKAAAAKTPPPSSSWATVTLLYCTPEQIKTERFRSVLQELHQQQRLTSFAVDEAHCISEWGHDFRTAYRHQLRWVRDTFPTVPVMACTATATPHVLKDITTVLKLEQESRHVGSFDRPNVSYQVRYKDYLEFSNPANTKNNNLGGAIGDLIQFVKSQHGLGTTGKQSKEQHQQPSKPCNGIIYVHKQKDTVDLAREIKQETGIPAIAYHGGMKDAERLQIQQSWMSGEAPIAVATVAFGMGIDLAHVRYVVHWTLSKSVEAFYQESGRAGRDGLPSVSLLYYSREEASLFQFLANKQKKDPERSLGALEMMVNYCMKPGCRRKYLLKFFGEVSTDPKTVCAGKCDYCQDPESVTKAMEGANASNEFSFQRGGGNKNEWDGQWNAPHGDGKYGDDDDDYWGETMESDGLLVRSNGISSEYFDEENDNKSSPNKKKARKKSVDSVLEKYEAVECMQNQKNGFVSFRSRVKRGGDSKENDDHNKNGGADEEKVARGVVIPEHLRLTAPDPMQHFQNMYAKNNNENQEDKITQNTIMKSSKDLSDELAQVQAKREALLLKLKSKRVAPPPPPPPAMGASTAHKKKKTR